VLGGVTASINILERLNRQLGQGEDKRVDNIAFGAAVNDYTAILYVAWVGKEDEQDVYYMRRIGCFCLHSAEHYINFRKQVLNILDWGSGSRLRAIQSALETIWKNAPPPRPLLPDRSASAPEATYLRLHPHCLPDDGDG